MNLRMLAAIVTAVPALAWAKPLAVCTDANPDGFDVVQYNALVTTNASADVLFSRLVEYDAQAGKVVPSVAQSWTASEDGLTWTFKLRSDVQFGAADWFKPTRPLNADDVVFSFERVFNPQHPWFKTSPSGYPSVQSLQLNKLVKAVKKVDDHTVQFELNYPDATFLPTLTMGWASIYSAEYANKLGVAKAGDFNIRPIGSGPFVLKSYQKDAVIRYDANPNWFGGKPKAEKLIFAITPDATVRLQRLKAGECQIALAPKPLDVQSAKADKNLKVVDNAAFMTAFVAINSQHKPLDNALVRQAINYAFDAKTYLKTVFDGTAQDASRPFPPNTWSFDKDLGDYNYDPAKAKELLKKAGFPNGFETTIWTRATGSVLNPNPKAGAELLQSDLAKVGIKATIKTIEWGELIKRGKAGEHDLLFMGWAGDNGDPDNFFTPQFSCAAVQSGTNFARYCDPQLDKLIADGKKVSDVAQRTKLYRSAQKVIFDQALWVPLAYPTAYALTRANVSGYKVSPFGRQDFASVTVN
ncbi:ABC transporter substrate-binding protein [Silvimonas amylolytica]|uniref:ABC transporter substrate-binding protein n=1 Tax=Silvimonas amylolytica TaxID=449663 RepID=A0ABQ2PKT5_9NEIS|nr:ABC transporter substrate-binding protein [Silvimonas amylolytica]GGP25821.1 ABC transporter substrate-binding protein [Silvimonas amylolytica]